MAGKYSLNRCCLMVWLDPKAFSKQTFEEQFKLMVLAFHPDRFDEPRRKRMEERMKTLNDIRENIRKGNYVDDR